MRKPADVVLAVVLTAVACADVNPDTTRSVPLALAAVVLAGGSLAVHRRAPWLPAAALLAVNLVLAATVPVGELYPPQLLTFAVLVSIYLLATQVAGRRAWAAGAVTLVLVVAGHVASPEGDFADFWPLLLWGGPWLAGRLVRRVREDATTRLALAEAAQERATQEAAAAERDRIARELHDVVAHAVSVMVVRAGGQRLRLAEQDPEAATAFADIEQAGREALTELRSMLDVLRGPDAVDGAREPLPGTAGITALVERMRGAGQDVELVEWDVPADLPAGVSLGAYRIVQEALTNALRHGAGPVELTVGPSGEDLRITARNVVGGRGRHDGAGRGLVGMRERIRLLGGTLAAEEDSGTWTLDARLPLSVPGRT